jgi:hypothetical protein
MASSDSDRYTRIDGDTHLGQVALRMVSVIA